MAQPLSARVAGGLSRLARPVWRGLKVVGRVALALGLVAGTVVTARYGYSYVLTSPHFALREIDIKPTAHLPRADILALAAVAPGDRLLALQSDAIAARIAEHPWVASVRVSRRLPDKLIIDTTERTAEAVALLGGLYLVDSSGRPFKRSTMAEAEILPVITGVGREIYVDEPKVAEAALREGLVVLKAYNSGGKRPVLSEVSLHPRHGISLFLREGGAEIGLGRGDLDKKLARFDRILEAVKSEGARGLSRLRRISLDGSGHRIPVLLEAELVPGVGTENRPGNGPASSPAPRQLLTNTTTELGDR